jgi:hypothetical protein
MSHAEEIAQRDVHARRLLPVVLDAQPEQPVPGILVVGYRDPDVTYNARSAEVGDHARFAQHDALAVVVASYEAVSAANPVRGESLDARKIEQAEQAPIGSLRGGAIRKQNERQRRWNRRHGRPFGVCKV